MRRIIGLTAAALLGTAAGAVSASPAPAPDPPDPPESCSGDLNGNGVVGFCDLLLVLCQWGECHWLCLGDANGDEMVDFDDLLIVLGHWGPCEPE